jgi:TetR/AcrR family transcriptional regulator
MEEKPTNKQRPAAPAGRGSAADAGVGTPASGEDAVAPRPKATRERILDAAEGLFSERGYAGTAVRDIAGVVGLNAASLYNHFQSKDVLYEAVLDRGLTPIFVLLSSIQEEQSGEGSPDFDESAVRRLVEHLAERPQLASLIHHESLSGGEYIARIGGRWLGPIYGEGISAVRRTTKGDLWEEAEYPLLIAAFHNMILGYFSLAPLMESLFGMDPLSKDSMELQTQFLTKVTRRLLGRS